MFRNRRHAGLLLARELARLATQEKQFGISKTTVIALPRGGVAVAVEIADTLKCPLDVLVSKKIGAPLQPELAVGAVSSDGVVVLNDEMTTALGIDDSYIKQQTKFLIDKTKALEEHWLSAAGIGARTSFRDRQIILVDDGIATGMTAIAAARSSRKRGADQVIIATPIISCHAYALLQKECDQIVALNVLLDFAAIGQFYLDFDQVSDDEVIRSLKQAKEARLHRQDMSVS